MKELGDLILMSSLLFVITCCHFPYGTELNRMVAQTCAQQFELISHAAHSTVAAAQPYLRPHSKHSSTHGRHVFRL